MLYTIQWWRAEELANRRSDTLVHPISTFEPFYTWCAVACCCFNESHVQGLRFGAYYSWSRSWLECDLQQIGTHNDPGPNQPNKGSQLKPVHNMTDLPLLLKGLLPSPEHSWNFLTTWSRSRPVCVHRAEVPLGMVLSSAKANGTSPRPPQKQSVTKDATTI